MPSERTRVIVDDSVLARYEGTYFTAASPFIVELVDGNLRVHMPGAPRTRLQATSRSVFFSEDLPAEYEFVEADSGSMSVIVRVGGLELRAESGAD